MRASTRLALTVGTAGAAVLAVALLVSSLPWRGDAGVRVRPGAPPFEKLSSYGFFEGPPARMEPAEGVLPYDLNTPLFSNYAWKQRFVWMPEGTSARYRDTSAFRFPVGAVLIKTFYYPHDARRPEAGRQLIETRLLIREKSGWNTLAYVWNEKQTEAYLDVTGAIHTVEWTDRHGRARSIRYRIPNKNDCRGCHVRAGTVRPIGPKARNLNKPYPYPEGTQNQLVRWTAAGYLEGAPRPEVAPKNAVWNDPTTGTLAERARAYLEINCTHCHNPEGPAKTSGLFLSVYQDHPLKLGYYKPPVAAGRGSGDLKYVIYPGHPEASILLYRMNSTVPDVRMPELARSVVHTEGVALIRRWIASLDTARIE